MPLDRGWSEQDVIDAFQNSTPFQQQVLGRIGSAPPERRSCKFVAEDLGVSWQAVAGAMSSLYQRVTRPMGIRDEQGRDSWPWTYGTDLESGHEHYVVKPEMAEVLRRLADE